MPRAKTAPKPYPWIVAALALGLVAGLIGAGSANRPQEGRTVVGVVAAGQSGTTLIRLWSDGTMEQSLVLPRSLVGECLAANWKPVEMCDWPTFEQLFQAPTLRGSPDTTAR